jgi:hypothetical protein
MPSFLQEIEEEVEQEQEPLTQDPSLLADKLLQEEKREEEEEQDDDEGAGEDDTETVEVEAEEEPDGTQEEEQEEAPDLPFINNMRWDCVEWWCHALLQQFSDDMIENLESLLKGKDLPISGRFYTRLRAAAFWQDILDLADDNWSSIIEKLEALHATFLQADANALMLLEIRASAQASSPSHDDETKNWPIFQKDYKDALRLLMVHEQFGKFERLLKVSNESTEDLEAIVARFETELKGMFDGQVPEELVSFLKVPDEEDHHVLTAAWHDQLHAMLQNDEHEFSRASLVSKLQELVQSWCDQILTAPKLVRLGYSCLEDPEADVHVAVNPKPAATAAKKSSKRTTPIWRDESSDDDSDSEKDDDTWDPSDAAGEKKAKAASFVEEQEYLDPDTHMVVAVPPAAAAASRSKTATPLRRSTRGLHENKRKSSGQKAAQKTNENNLSFNESSDEEADLDDAPPPQKRRRVQLSGKKKKSTPKKKETYSTSEEESDEDEDDFLPTAPVRPRGRSLSSKARVSLSTNASPRARARSAPPRRRRGRRMSAPKTYAGRRRFTDDESNAIKEGVAIYGKGKWCEIKELAGDRLFHRNTIQIKDRYRSLIKLGEILRFNYD